MGVRPSWRKLTIISQCCLSPLLRNKLDLMKTTIELPAPAIRQARALAAEQGIEVVSHG